MNRSHALALLGGVLALGSCARNEAVVVGSKNFTESILLAELYAQRLQAHGIPTQLRLNLGSTQIAMAAIARAQIDLYPEYSGTALIDVLNLPPQSNAAAIERIVAHAFLTKYDLVWLQAAPMNDSQGLATTTAIGQRLKARTLSQLAPLTSHLRLATIPEFLTRPDGLPGLQRVYGGFHFAQVRTYDIGLKYDALLQGKADIATAFTTDGAIALHHLLLFEDNRHLWPPYNPAPVVRAQTLRRFPGIRAALNGLAPALTTARVQEMNAHIEGNNADPADVAAAFLREHLH